MRKNILVAVITTTALIGCGGGNSSSSALDTQGVTKLIKGEAREKMKAE